jgi:RNA polymerase sigma factor (sigma-70 family)
MRGRSAGRRREREHKVELADPEGVPTPEQLVDRARVQQRVARGVLELDEPFRSTVLLRYYEGLSSAEIARRLSIPAATVRARLKTGLDRLRAASPARQAVQVVVPGAWARLPAGE